MSSDFEKAYTLVLKNYSMVKDVHETAYENNEAYKIFWNGQSEEVKKRIEKARKLNSIGSGTNKFQEGLLHASTFGLSFGIKKIFQAGKPTRKEQIYQTVTSGEFTELIDSLNKLLGLGEV